MTNTINIGREGEKRAEELLTANEWKIIERGTCRTAWDLRIKQGRDILAVNVKVGKNSYGMNKHNIQRLLTHCVETAEIPAYLFIIGNGYALFSFEEGKNLHFKNLSPNFIQNYTLVKK